MTNPICTVDGCCKPIKSKHLCNAHYKRLVRHGDPLLGGRARHKDARCSLQGCSGKHKGRGYCYKHLARFRRHGDPLAGRVENGLLLEFVKLAAKSKTDDCIIWPYGKTDRGYGGLQVENKKYMAHRLALEIAVGPPPAGKEYACHLPIVCHNPSCINPRHLRWASPKQNMLDRVLDGTRQRGEDVPNSRLTSDDVMSIRKDERKHQTIADDYGVSKSCITAVKSKANWSWLN